MAGTGRTARRDGPSYGRSSLVWVWGVGEKTPRSVWRGFLRRVSLQAGRPSETFAEGGVDSVRRSVAPPLKGTKQRRSLEGQTAFQACIRGLLRGFPFREGWEWEGVGGQRRAKTRWEGF